MSAVCVAAGAVTSIFPVLHRPYLGQCDRTSHRDNSYITAPPQQSANGEYLMGTLRQVWKLTIAIAD